MVNRHRRRLWQQQASSSRQGGSVSTLLPLLLLLARPGSIQGFIGPPLAPASRRAATLQLGATESNVQPPDRTLPLPGPPGEWEGLPPERHAEFLRDFWQRRPLLVRKAFDPSVAVVGPAELLGLACDDRVASRLIERWRVGGGNKGSGVEWSVRQGPFEEEDFEEEEEQEEEEKDNGWGGGGGRKWTVLVNEVDRHVPEVADILNTFRFVPNWRVDDVMISYAPTEGGIGPHVDNYDVFLLQGRGTRQWRIQGALLGGKEEREGLIPDSPVRILANFQEDHAWVLEPGDMLYLPPRVPHDGVSLDGDCMTYSIGFRAPAQRELLTAAAAAAQALLEGDGAFYTDCGLGLPAATAGEPDAGEITPTALHDLRQLIQDALTPILEDDARLAQWLGRHLTAPRRPRLGGEEYPPRPLWALGGGVLEEEGLEGFPALMSDWDSAKEVVADIRAGQDIELYRAEGVKFAHAAAAPSSKSSQSSTKRWLFVDGRAWAVPAPATEEGARRVCALLTGGKSPIPSAAMRGMLEKKEGGVGEALEALLMELLDGGLLYPLQVGALDDDEEEG